LTNALHLTRIQAEQVRSSEMHKTEITLPPRSLTLSRNALKRLCEIVSKATEGDPDAELVFILSAKGASVSSQNVEDLMNTKWPKDIEKVRLLASSHKNNKWVAANFDNSRPNYNRITISGFDSDWVASIAEEIDAFIAVHRNIHWLFNGKLLTSLHGLLLVGLHSIQGGKSNYGRVVINFFRDGVVNIRGDFLWVANPFGVCILHRKSIPLCVHR